MKKSSVYFTDLRVRGTSLPDKLEKLVKKAGIKDIDFKDKFTAIKIHFGEPGNLAYIRPNYTAKIVKLLRDLGGIVYLTDSNTLYKGKRSNAVDHLQSATENGFNPLSAACNVIIADGLKGMDYREVVINKPRCASAKIGSAIADADIIISMTHFKGHDMTAFGGVLKNLGMGSGSKGGKLEMHSSSKPVIDKEKCKSCGLCIRSCPQEAIFPDDNKKAAINMDKCIGCGQCIAVCPYEAANPVWNQSLEIANEKIAEYAFAAINGKPNFHISFIMDVSPDCDCAGSNDLSLVPNIGIAASFDPVALDRLCVDLVNKAPLIKGSVLDDLGGYKEGMDKFGHLHSGTNWEKWLEYAEKIGLGTQEYELIEIK